MFDEKKFLAALEAEKVKIESNTLSRVIRRMLNPAGCEQCGQTTKTATVQADGSLKTTCCGFELSPAPKKGK